MSATYKVGRGRATKTVQARQYTRDQDFTLAAWIGKARIYRDHIRIDISAGEELRASKGDWITKEHKPDGTIVYTVVDGNKFAVTYKEVPDAE